MRSCTSRRTGRSKARDRWTHGEALARTWGRWPVCPSRSRISSPPSTCRPRAGHASSTAGSRPTRPPSRSGSGRLGRSFSARRTWTSSPWVRLRRIPRSGPAAIPGTSAGCRGAPLAVQPPRWPRTRCRWRSAPTREARSASQRRSAGSSGRNRPTAARPGTGSSRSRPPLTRRGRSPAPCSTRPCCTRRSPGTTTAIRHRLTRRCRRSSPRRGRPTWPGCGSAW